MHFSKWVTNYSCKSWDWRLVCLTSRHVSVVFVAAMSNKLARADTVLTSFNCSLLVVCLLCCIYLVAQSPGAVVFPVWSQINDSAVHFEAPVMNFHQPLVMLKDEFDCSKELKQILKLVPICYFRTDSSRHWQEVKFRPQIICHLSVLPNPEMIREDKGEGTDENADGNLGIWWMGRWVTGQVGLYWNPAEIRENFMADKGEYWMKCKFKVLKATVGGEFPEFFAYSKLGALCRHLVAIISTWTLIRWVRAAILPELTHPADWVISTFYCIVLL